MQTKALRLFLLALTCSLAMPVPADPPDWAPAHGYRDKHKHHDDDDRYESRGSDGVVVALPWADSHHGSGYVRDGRCNRDALGAVLGGVVGGVVGSQVGKGDGRTAATVIGTVVGILVGQSIGRSMDAADQNCTSQALEYVPDGQPVAWNNPDQQGDYVVTPRKTWRNDSGAYCREYITQATVAGQRQQTYGSACRQPDGTWRVAN